MTDLAVRSDDATENLPATPAQTPAPQPMYTSELLLWVEEARQANKIAQSLANTSFVPASLRGKPHDITAAILAGKELGLQPMATLRSMDVIQGTPALRAHAMRGLVQSHGHKVWLEKQTPTVVIYQGQRREADGSYGKVQTSEWTIERARDLGLLAKDQWKKQPQTMLTARATGEICRLIASDVLHAMPYAVEELDESNRYESTAAPIRVTAAEITTAAALPAPAGPVTAAEIVANGSTPAAAQTSISEADGQPWPTTAQPPDHVEDGGE
ncbi:hypothetical protein K1W54_04945 [Micromonospora sp. CPCC 205371]|nr:hypothetical protein [Micromonospora sp. CPCC 205371]